MKNHVPLNILYSELPEEILRRVHKVLIKQFLHFSILRSTIAECRIFHRILNLASITPHVTKFYLD